jgi:hypothetical protein
VPRFLSPEWLSEAVEAVAAGRTVAPDGPPMALRQVVEGTPEGTVRYVVRLGPGGLALEVGDGNGTPTQVDAEIRQDYPTAVAISRGEITPAAAAAAGRLRVSGSMRDLVRTAPAFTALSAALAPLRQRTSY